MAEGYQPPQPQQVVYQQQQPQQVVYQQPVVQGQGQQPVQGQQPQVVYVQPQQQPPQHQVVVVQQPPTQQLVTRLPYGPTVVTCPQCKTNIQTQVRLENGTATWLACLGVFCLGGVCGCCLIPFCIDNLKDAYHSCPQCRTSVGVRKAM